MSGFEGPKALRPDDVTAKGKEIDLSEKTGFQPEDYNGRFSVVMPEEHAAALRAWFRDNGFGPSAGPRYVMMQFMKEKGIKPAPPKPDMEGENNG